MTELDELPDTSPRPPWLRGATILVVTAALLASAAVYSGYHALIAFDPDDTQHLETPLAMAAARQLADGPRTLYGPFSGSDPLVLIHAPLYYRTAALLAWPMARSGVAPYTATLIAGRSLSFLALIAVLLAAGWIARIDGLPGPAGAWAALLIASSPVFGSLGFTVRPDVMGIALQTLGFGLVLRALRDGIRGPWPTSVLAGVCFGLAVCAKQHLIVAAGVGALLLVVAAIGGRVRRSSTAVGLALGVLIPAGYFAFEEWMSGGMMSRSVLGVASEMRHLAPGSWEHVGRVFIEVAKLALGLIAFAFAVFLVSPTRAIRVSGSDAALWLVLLAETAAMVPLLLGSEGAWVNYAMPGAVWASILLARAAVRVLDAPTLGLRTLALWIAVAVVFARDVQLAAHSYAYRSDDHAVIAQVLADTTVAATPAEARYFVGLPQYTRRYGRAGLAHDEWLYRAYEATGLAEPRSRWLLSALIGRPAATGSDAPRAVSIVVVPSDPGTNRSDYVYGLDATLPDLGYRNIQQYGRFAVWKRMEAP